MNGLALERAAMAAQAQAAASSNPTPVHSEDLQPNEAVRRRKGTGLPPVVASTTRTTDRTWVARRGGKAKDWVVFNQTNWLDEMARRQDKFKSGGPSWNRGPLWKAQDGTSSTASSSSTQHPHPRAKQPRPIPLPPRPSGADRETHAEPTNTMDDDRVKPYTKPLPALKPKPPLSKTLATLMAPASVATVFGLPMEAEGRQGEGGPSLLGWDPSREMEFSSPDAVLETQPSMSKKSQVGPGNRHPETSVQSAAEITEYGDLLSRLRSERSQNALEAQERYETPMTNVPYEFPPAQAKRHPFPAPRQSREGSSSQKRRKIDNPLEPLEQPTPFEIPSATMPTSHQSQLLSNPPHTTTSERPQPVSIPPSVPSPPATRVPASPVHIKCEPQSPSPIERRKTVTRYVTRFPLPDNCNKTNPHWQINRATFRVEKESELRGKGLKLVGRSILRDDGVSLEWRSSHPVWSDTLEPFSSADGAQNKDHADPSRDSPLSRSLSSENANRLPDSTSNVPGPSAPADAENNVYLSPQFVSSRSPSRTSQRSMADALVASASSPDIPAIAGTSSSPMPPEGSKRKRGLNIPPGGLDLATAIELSQRNNASPVSSGPYGLVASPSRSTGSPSVAIALPYSQTPIYATPRPAERARSHLAVPQQRGREAKPKQRLPPQKAKPLAKEWLEKSTNDEDANEINEGESFEETGPSAPREATEIEKSGWTAIEQVNVADMDEEDLDELLDDNEDEIRSGLEVGKVISVHDSEVDLVDRGEVAAVPPASGSSLGELSTTHDEEATDDALSRDFITRYMKLHETDRNGLISVYAPDAVLRYRLPDGSHSSPQLQKTSFPLVTAKGRDEIASSFLELQRLHFSYKLDENGNKKVDLEYYQERSRDDISLYVRTMVIVQDTENFSSSEQNRVDIQNQQMHVVDHDFWLCKTRSEEPTLGSNSAKTDWPLIIRNHLIIMHEAPL